VCLLPAGAGHSLGLALAGFGAGGLIYGPFVPIVTAMLQRITPRGELAAVLAALRSGTALALPLGGVLGGLLVTAFGAGRTLLASALATLALGAATGVAVAVSALRGRAGQPGTERGLGSSGAPRPG
jgi:hypothetical protein